MTKKKDLGQFFTTNVDYILNGFESVVKGKVVTDPFAGKCDLLAWAIRNNASSVQGLDIDSTLIGGNVSFNDSLKCIPKSNFILTNPPYLAKNKMSDLVKSTYLEGSKVDDLYLLSISKIIDSESPEGIIIVPVNFFSADNSSSIRKKFLNEYKVTKVNLFTQSVFDDTTYNVVAFHFEKSRESIQEIAFTLHPNGPVKNFTLEKEFNYSIGGRELNPIMDCKNLLKPIRIVESYFGDGNVPVSCFFNDFGTNALYYTTYDKSSILLNNIITLSCIDTNSSQSGWIKAVDTRTLGKTCLVGKHSSRNIASIIVNTDIQTQEKLISTFNKTINELRIKYNSLFLTNFRDNNRKRVAFEFCYKLLNYCYSQI